MPPEHRRGGIIRRTSSSGSGWPSWILSSRFRVALSVAGICGLTVVSIALRGVSGQPLEAVQLLPTTHFHPQLVRCPHALTDLDTGTFPMEAELENGETVGTLLADLGVDATNRQEVIAALGDHLEVRHLRPGLQVTAVYRDGGQPIGLEFHLPGKGELQLTSTPQGRWEREWAPFEERIELRRAEGVIDDSLAGALEAANAPTDVAYRMAEVLRWDVDFHRDLRRGDSFRVLYEQVLLDGEPYRTGDVVAVEMVNRGRELEAYRFGDGGYYDANGRPLKKMFLRAPLPFSRITSRFSQHRFHPDPAYHAAALWRRLRRARSARRCG